MNDNVKNNAGNMPDLLCVSPSPHLKSHDTTRSIMIDVLIALVPAFIWGVYMMGLRALVIGLLSVLCCVLFEAGSQLLLRRPVTVSDCSAAVTGLIFAMNLPVAVPLWMPVVGSFFAIVVVKQLFGGIGKNIVNPALAARVFLFTAWAGQMTRFIAPGNRVSTLSVTLGDVDMVTSATPLAALKNGVMPSATLGDMLVGNIGGSIGEVSSILLLLGGVYLIIRRVITWHIPVSYLGTVALLTFLFPQTGTGGVFMAYQLMAGGLMIGAFFMATDYVTSPITPIGRLIFGVGCGGITVLIRYFGSYPEGVSFAILIMNLLVWYLDLAGMPKRFGAVKEKVSKK